MNNAIQVLIDSFLVVLALLVAATARVGFSGYASVLGGRQFGYKFDRTRLPRWGYTLLTIMGICFVYALIISHQAGTAIGFCIIVVPFAALGTLLNVCYVPRDSKSKPATKSSGKSKNDSWLT
jgi:hypothetical protein